MLLAGPAASASGNAQVRFVQAIPAIDSALLTASEGGLTETIADSVRFGAIGDYADVPAGSVTFQARRADGGGIATVRERLVRGGRYTVLALGDGDRRLLVLRDGPAHAGEARLRVVHAAPELGEVDVRLGARALAEAAALEEVSAYVSVDPGTYDLSVVRPDNGELAARHGVSLAAGSASSAFVVGSGGEPVRIVVATDRTAAPAAAPATGLGGLAGDGDRLLAALLAALLAGSAGLAAYLIGTGRSRGHDS